LLNFAVNQVVQDQARVSFLIVEPKAAGMAQHVGEQLPAA
jgi:hypothetical protein